MAKIQKRKKKKTGLIIFFIIIVLIIGAGVYAGSYIAGKLSALNIEEIDTSELDANEELYEEVSDTLSKEEFENIITFALFGTDSRDTNNMSAGRSDSIIIASINTNTQTVKLISIPRDTYVSVDGYGKTKINHAYAYGGAKLAIKTINQNFGLDITEYATIDFSGLIHIINKIGGIQLKITKSEMDYINTYSVVPYKISGNEYKALSNYGTVTLTGEQALAHSRNRTTGAGTDFNRAERQRDVLEAMMKKLAKMGSSKLLNMSDTLLREVRTNINVMNYVGKLTDIILNSSKYFSNLISIQIPSTEYGKGQTINGTYYFVADNDTMRQDMIDTIYKK